MSRLAGKTALITGAGNGIGRATALRFASEGARVVAADFNEDARAGVAADIENGGGTCLAVDIDVTDQASVDEAIALTVERFGAIDVLFNSAGGGSTADGSVAELSLDEFWRTVRVDLFGTLLCCRAVIPHMKAAGRGSIINMSSLRAIIGTQGADAYTASKGGVLSMSRAMAMQLAADNVRVNVMAPGVVLTERVAAFIRPDNPVYRKSLLGPAEPEDVANLAVFLASDESRKMTGTVVPLDGGASIC